MKNFDEKAAQEMRVKAYQERERKRLEVSLHTRGFFCDEAWMKRKKKGINQTAFTHAVIVLDICELLTKSNQTFWMKNCYTKDTLQQTIYIKNKKQKKTKKNMDERLSILSVQVRQSLKEYKDVFTCYILSVLTEKVHVNIKVRLF